MTRAAPAGAANREKVVNISGSDRRDWRTL
jgi:hypothetical protein